VAAQNPRKTTSSPIHIVVGGRCGRGRGGDAVRWFEDETFESMEFCLPSAPTVGRCEFGDLGDLDDLFSLEPEPEP